MNMIVRHSILSGFLVGLGVMVNTIVDNRYAVYCKKMLITVFCIMVFILSGYEHCIADFHICF